MRERHRLFVDIVRLAGRLGVEFAFPTRTLHLASAPPGFAGASSPTLPDARGAGDEPPGEALRLGRAEAEAIMSSEWPGGAQSPVSFDDPARISAGRGPENP